MAMTDTPELLPPGGGKPGLPAKIGAGSPPPGTGAEQIEDDPRKELRIGGIIAFLFFVVFLGWAAFAPLDAGAYAQGTVVVSGNLPGKPLPNGQPGPSLYCAVIVKTVDAQTRSKTGINELLRD